MKVSAIDVWINTIWKEIMFFSAEGVPERARTFKNPFRILSENEQKMSSLMLEPPPGGVLIPG